MEPELNNKTLFLFNPHLKHLSAKLERISNQLRTFEPNRFKRGLIDGLGSIIKGISGNLDFTDAIKYDRAIQVLEKNEIKLETEFNSHVTLNKNWISENSKIIKSLVKNQDEIDKVLKVIMKADADRETDLIKYAHMAQHLLILGDNIEDLSEELQRLENILAFIRTSTTPHSIVSIEELRSMLDRIKVLYSKDEILDVEFRNLYDIVKLGYFYLGMKLVIVIKVPIVYPITYNFYKLSIVPNKNHKSLIPTLPFIAISGEKSRYMEAECPKVKSWFLCISNSNYVPQDKPDCVHQLITKQELNQSCEFTSVLTTSEAFDELDDKHYALIFPNPTKVKVFCGQEQYRVLHGSYLAVIPLNCYLKTPLFTIINSNDRIKGHPVKILEMPQNYESRQNEHPTITLNSASLDKLHSISTKILMEPSVHLERSTDHSLYHTTIPVYAILIGLGVLIALTTYCRLRRKRLQGVKEVKSTKRNSEIETAAPLTSKSIPSKDIKIDYGNISAAFSKSLE